MDQHARGVLFCPSVFQGSLCDPVAVLFRITRYHSAHGSWQFGERLRLRSPRRDNTPDDWSWRFRRRASWAGSIRSICVGFVDFPQIAGQRGGNPDVLRSAGGVHVSTPSDLVERASNQQAAVGTGRRAALDYRSPLMSSLCYRRELVVLG